MLTFFGFKTECHGTGSHGHEIVHHWNVKQRSPIAWRGRGLRGHKYKVWKSFQVLGSKTVLSSVNHLEQLNTSCIDFDNKLSRVSYMTETCLSQCEEKCLRNLRPRKLTLARTCSQEVPCSNLGLETNNPDWSFSWFSSVALWNARMVCRSDQATFFRIISSSSTVRNSLTAPWNKAQKMRGMDLRSLWGWEVDWTGSGSCLVVDVCVIDIEPPSSAVWPAWRPNVKRKDQRSPLLSRLVAWRGLMSMLVRLKWHV
jgi:hypothetical protein